MDEELGEVCEAYEQLIALSTGQDSRPEKFGRSQKRCVTWKPAGGGVEVWQLIRDWLCVWTSSQGGIPVDHGIPQGPIASDFLAEASCSRSMKR